jgi:hypothetical protein
MNDKFIKRKKLSLPDLISFFTGCLTVGTAHFFSASVRCNSWWNSEHFPSHFLIKLLRQLGTVPMVTVSQLTAGEIFNNFLDVAYFQERAV